ncbi:MAG: N-acetyltransferase [Lysobacteraceae bacterium]|nr:MAG: N-acetyltransferase [Xanthomonadaceae bacterium]
MQSEIRHDDASHRFLVEVDGHAGHLEYEHRDGVMVITHTIVPSAIGGRGIAAALVKAAVEHARDEGLKVDPQCGYAEAWMGRNPDYQGLRA